MTAGSPEARGRWKRWSCRSVAWVAAAGILAVGSVQDLGGSRRLEATPAQSSADRPLHDPFTELLDLYVRDGFVYYRALQIDRQKLLRYIAGLDVPSGVVEAWPRNRQVAFWVNAYNAFVIQTVVDHYPIRGVAKQYPANSIRQIPGAFDRLSHRAGGRNLTLDELEATVLAGFDDPRLFLALGRGAVGSPRLRSEAFTADQLETQLSEVVREFSTRPRLVEVDVVGAAIRVSPIASWRETAFVARYGNGTGDPRFAQRSPIERAILAIIEPHLLPTERRFVEQNDFQMTFQEFDWRLNDLTGGRVD